MMRTLRPWNIKSNSTEKKSIEKDGKVTITVPKTCTVNQDKPECSLIQELQEIQHTLNVGNEYKKKMEHIMSSLIGNPNGAHVGYYWIGGQHIGNNGTTPLTELVYSGTNYRNTDEIDKMIDLLHQYKEAVIKYEEYEEKRRTLEQREKEIKLQLGIR